MKRAGKYAGAIVTMLVTLPLVAAPQPTVTLDPTSGPPGKKWR